MSGEEGGQTLSHPAGVLHVQQVGVSGTRFRCHLVPELEAARAPRPLLHVGAARRRGRVRPYLNLYAHPGLMGDYARLTLGRSEA
jgi:hypothetical protein